MVGGEEGRNVQCGQHVARRDAVDADAGLGPFYAQRGGEVAHGGFGGVVGPVSRVKARDNVSVFFNCDAMHSSKERGVSGEPYACGWGTFTMAPLMLPMKTMLPWALRSIYKQTQKSAIHNEQG